MTFTGSSSIWRPSSFCRPSPLAGATGTPSRTRRPWLRTWSLVDASGLRKRAAKCGLSGGVAFHNPDLVVGQAVEVVDEPVDLAVGGVAVHAGWKGLHGIGRCGHAPASERALGRSTAVGNRK